MRNFCLTLASLAFLASCAGAQEKTKPSRDPLEAAVDRALAYLQLTQEKDGAWMASGSKSAAITGLSVMAFLSAGHVPGEGRYGATVEKGVRWVLKAQQPNGLIAAGTGYEMYHHGICTLMLAEAAGMTDYQLGEEIRKKLGKAVEVILIAQRQTGTNRGGWRYRVQGADADISVTGWQLMALRAAKNLGCDVPPERIDWAVEYLKRCQDPSGGGFSYMAGQRAPSAARTGTGVLGLEICGKDRHHSPEALKGGGFLIKNSPQWGRDTSHFYYAVYYCAQAMFQLGNNYWSHYRPQLHKALLPNQGKNGSWSGNDADSRYGLPYCTAMSVLALTVEYRYLPIYQRGEEPTDRSR